MQHLRLALRKLILTPSFSVVAILTLALAIAANTAIFSIVDTILIKPLPFRDAAHLITINHAAPGLDLERMGQSEAIYLRYRELSRSFSETALYSQNDVTLTGSDRPERLRAASLTPSIFAVLDVTAPTGRVFRQSEGEPGGDRVALLSHDLWQQRFGADPSILGQTLHIDGQTREVIGVMAKGFGFPGDRTEIWLPMVVDPLDAPLGSFGAQSIARLNTGTDIDTARRELELLLSDLPAVFPDDSASRVLSDAGFRPELQPLRDSVVGNVESTLWLLLATVAFVLLIACANVANLYLARADSRQREMALRTALGASRGHLASGALIESGVLAIVAGLLALAPAQIAISWLVAHGPQDTPRLHEVAIDGRALLFNFAIAAFAGILFGLLPAIRLRVDQLAAALKEGGKSTTAGRERNRARQVLVAAQVALAIVVLVVSGLMVRSLIHLNSVDSGFQAAGTLAFELSLPEAKYADDLAAAAFYSQLTDRLSALPGVRSASAASFVPFSNEYSATGLHSQDRPLADGAPPPVFARQVTTPGFFDTLGIPIIAGEAPRAEAAMQRHGRLWISQGVAQQMWPDEPVSAVIGKRVFSGRPSEQRPDPWFEVAGVVGEVNYLDLTEAAMPVVYYPQLALEAGDWIDRRMDVVLRFDDLAAATSSTAMTAAIRDIVWSLDADLPVTEITSLERYLERARAPRAFSTLLLLIASGVALLLGVIGTYGVISYLVSQRTGEIGIRMAIGAASSDIRRLVLRQGLAITGAGVCAGLVLAAVGSRWLQSQLFEVQALDPLTFASVTIIISLVALAACWLPARRAARVEPLVALRHE